MNVLYSAFECNPNRGSEAYCGWSTVINMSKIHNVFVITRKENKAEIEEFCNKEKVKNIKFFYCDINDRLNLYYKYGKFYMQYYVLWQKQAYKLAKKIIDTYDIQIVHHITLGDFRVIGQMWKLNTKFVFGPVGGAQYIPSNLKEYSKRHILKEKFRKCVNDFKKVDIRYKIALKNAEKVFCANEETINFLKEIDKENNEKYELLTENGINEIHDKMFIDDKDLIKIIWFGRIVYRKGIEFLVDVLPLIKTNKKFVVYIYGRDQDNEIPYLMKKIKEYNVEDKIKFMGIVEHNEIDSIYRDADFFVFPSLRETTGTVIFEAMSYGLPIIGFKQNGIKLIASEKTAILIDTSEKLQEIKEKFASAMKLLIENTDYRRMLSKNSIERIQKFYWNEKIEYISNIYNEILKKEKNTL